jgi:FkbM family methyltransferase
MAQAPIQFDRTSGALEGANLWERTAALALSTGSKISSHFSHRGYIHCANLLRKTLPERNIAIKLNDDATFEFPYGDGYWSKLLNRSYHYEDELELLFSHSADVDYTLIDCGANYGYWSVLVSSAPFGSHRAIAIEPSSQNFDKLANNARINGDRFELMKCAIGAGRGTAHLSGTKHEAFSIAGQIDAGQVNAAFNGGGEEVPVIALDHLIDDGKVSARGKYLIKLDVEGVEIEAIKGGTRLLQTDSVILCEEHGNDPQHTVSRYIMEKTPLKLIVYDPRSRRMETVTELSILDRIKVSSHVGYNVFGTASLFWEDRFNALNADAARRLQ